MFPVKLWPWRGPEGEEDLAQIEQNIFCYFKMLLPVPSGSSTAAKLVLGTQVVQIFNNFLSTDAFFSTETPFCFRITRDNTDTLLNLYLTIV